MCNAFFTPGMVSFLKYILFFLIIMILFSLFDLPDWISRKLNGESKASLRKKVADLEERVRQLEEKNNSNQ